MVLLQLSYSQVINTNCITHTELPLTLKILSPDGNSSLNKNGEYRLSGITMSDLQKIKFTVAGQAEEYNAQNDISNQSQTSDLNFKPNDFQIQSENSWNLIDSVSFKCYLPAGSNLGVKLNLKDWKFDLIEPYKLTEEAKGAVKKSPSWIRPALEYTLSKVSQQKQISLASIINSAVDPYIDEIAFAIAYSTPEFLSSSYCYPELFEVNALLIYEHDKDLNYVDIVDYGSSSTDDGCYSTLKYWRIDTNGVKYQVEVPKEVYYMFLVHPKITDDIQSFINPSLAECYSDNTNHTLNIQSPPNGKLWRDYLYTFTEPIPNKGDTLFPVLKDSVSQCEVVWDDRKDNQTNSAIKVITKWVNDVMDINSGTERPHQPNRIYKLHLGRCGEHEDITCAASRASLIPSRGIEAFSSDHVWNEFWDRDWQQWEPVNNSYYNKFVYSVGWGKKFGSVLCHESNGVFSSVTDLYCEQTSTLNIYALDNNNKPIDGARILLAVQGTLDSTSIYIDTYGITDNQGKCSFVVQSGSRYYFARMDSPLGNSPVDLNQVYNLIQNPVAGNSYNFQLKASGTMPTVSFDNQPLPSDTTKDFRIDVDFNIDKQVIKWQNYFDDLQNTYTILERDIGSANCFIADTDNYNKCVSKAKFTTYNPLVNSTGSKFRFFAPENKPWVAFINTGNSLQNLVLVDAIFKFYLPPDFNGIDLIALQKKQMLSISPNPIENTAVISFSLDKMTFSELNIVSASGIIIKHLFNKNLDIGNHTIVWDTKDDNGIAVPPGIYIATLNTGNFKTAKSLIVIK